MRLVNQRLTEIEAEMQRQEENQIQFDRLVAAGMDPTQAQNESGYDPWAAPDARELQALAATQQTFHTTAHRAIGDTDVMRLQVGGVHGGPVEVEHSIYDELTRDDPQRLFRLMRAAARATVASREIEAGGVADVARLDLGQ